jgi:DMSO reductase anchor subunit
VRESGFVGVGVVLGWLASKTWSDPGCQLGLVVFLVATAVMTLGFLFAVVGHGRDSRAGDPDDDDDDEGDHS